MFENIVGQGRVVEELRSEISGSRLPHSLLLHGPGYSGKLTTALEIARALTCEQGAAEWSCSCKSCSLQRLLIHPFTLLLGPRYFEEEIRVCSELVKQSDQTFARFLFIRAVAKLTARLDPRLWEGNEQKLQGARAPLERVRDCMETFYPGRDLPEDKTMHKLLDQTVEDCGKIAKSIPTDNIPIDQVRRAAFWAHTTSPGAAKVMILENADRMQAGSRNAVLKILEEPPEHCYLLLLTTRREGIIQTVRSRLRPYVFQERDEDESRAVLERIFRDDSHGYGSVAEYFRAWDSNPELYRNAGLRFVSAVIDNDTSVFSNTESADSLLTTVKGKRELMPFLAELTRTVRQTILFESFEGSSVRRAALNRAERWVGAIRTCSARAEQLNIGPPLLLEELFYTMRERE